MTNLPYVGVILKKAREEKGISIEVLAKAVNMPINKLVDIEKGDQQASPIELRVLMEVLGLLD